MLVFGVYASFGAYFDDFRPSRVDWYASPRYSWGDQVQHGTVSMGKANHDSALHSLAHRSGHSNSSVEALSPFIHAKAPLPAPLRAVY